MGASYINGLHYTQIISKLRLSGHRLFRLYSNLGERTVVMAQITTQGLVRCLLWLSMVTIASTQAPSCPNNLAVYNPNLRTECLNSSMLHRNFLLPSYRSQNILMPLHSLLHRTSRHHHGRRRHKAVPPRATAYVRQDPLSERISGREAPRACHYFTPERHPHDGAADPDAIIRCLYHGAVCRSPGRRQDWVHL